MTLPLLDAYLGFAFREQSDVWPQLEAQGLTLAQAQAAWDYKHDVFGSDYSGWTVAKAIAVFGAPIVQTEETIAWSLTLWPDHQFWGSIREPGQIFTSDRISLRQPQTIEPLEILDYDALRSRLHLGWHCEAELRALVGAPVAEDGWSPEYSSFYGPLLDGSYLEVVTEWGMTSTLKRALVPTCWVGAPPAPQPWWKRLIRPFNKRAV